jgi:hypothetical protein
MKFKCASADLNFIHEAPIQLEYLVDINASALKTYRVLDDPATWPFWFHGMSAATPLQQDHSGVWRKVTLNRFIDFREEFIVRESPYRLAYRVAAVSIPYADELVECFDVEETEQGVRVRYRIGLRVHKKLWPLKGVIKAIGTHAYKKSLRALKVYIESTAD